jgi:hypothetical protein
MESIRTDFFDWVGTHLAIGEAAFSAFHPMSNRRKKA